MTKVGNWEDKNGVSVYSGDKVIIRLTHDDPQRTPFDSKQGFVHEIDDEEDDVFLVRFPDGPDIRFSADEVESGE